MKWYEIVFVFFKIEFCLSFTVNSFLIYLTVFHVKSVTGTYKKIVVLFAIQGVLLSGLEIIGRPFVHNYNKAMIFFSLNTWFESYLLILILVAMWGRMYVCVLAFIAVQFLYRYFCLFNVKMIHKFKGIKSLVWMLYPFMGGMVTSLTLLSCLPDEYSDEYER